MTKQQQNHKSNNNKQQLKQKVSNSNHNPPQLQQSAQNNNHATNNQDQSLKKKIIKKFNFNLNINRNPAKKSTIDSSIVQQDDQLKNWKPKKLNQISSNKASQKIPQIKGKQIASSFLSFLPKPTSNLKQQDLSSVFQNNLNKKKAKPIFKIQQKQQKWDGEDEFLHKNLQINLNKVNAEKKQPQKVSQIHNIEEKQQIRQQKLIEKQDQEQQIIVEKIKWLSQDNEQNEKSKNNKVSLADIIDKEWQKQYKKLGK